MSASQNAEVVRQFRNKTGADAAAAQFWLEATGFHLDTAVQLYNANTDAPPRQTVLDPLMGPSVAPQQVASADVAAEAARASANLASMRAQHETLRRIASLLKDRLVTFLEQDDPANPKKEYTFATIGGQKHVVKLRPNALVIDAFVAVEHATGIPFDQMRFTYQGNVLEHERPLTAYGIAPGATITLVLRLMGD